MLRKAGRLGTAGSRTVNLQPGFPASPEGGFDQLGQQAAIANKEHRTDLGMLSRFGPMGSLLLVHVALVPLAAGAHLVMTTPQGTGAPTNLWPDTDTEPMGFLKVTMGASRRRKGIIMPNSAPSQWMKKRSSV